MLKIITSRQWFGFVRLKSRNLWLFANACTEGCMAEFYAPVEMDYKLEHPTRVVVDATKALSKPQ